MCSKKQSNMGSDNGLAWVRHCAIIWTNDGLVYWRIYASLGLNELRELGLPLPTRDNKLIDL